MAVRSAVALMAASVIISTGQLSIFPAQFDTVADVPSHYFNEDHVVYGRIERVIDGDTVRIRHCRYSFYCENRMKKVTTTASLWGRHRSRLQSRGYIQKLVVEEFMTQYNVEIINCYFMNLIVNVVDQESLSMLIVCIDNPTFHNFDALLPSPFPPGCVPFPPAGNCLLIAGVVYFSNH